MKNAKKIQVPFDKETAASLKAGDKVLLTGIIYTARDQAHLRFSEMIRCKEDLPIDLAGQVIYYCGPSPRGERIIGSCGPTTSSRMDRFTPELLDAGLKGMIGKGRRSKEVIASVKKNGAVYFLAPPGAAAYLSGKVKKCEVVAFDDLGAEAVYRLEVEDFPVVVGIDSQGNDIYSGFQKL